MPRGKYVNHKGRARHFTSPDELERERKKLENKKWRAKKEDDEESGEEEEEEEKETPEGAGAAGGKSEDESSEEDSDDAEHKAKGVEGLIEIENPNRVVKKEKKISKLGMEAPAAEEPTAKPELSRREREELEKQRAKAHYQKLHAEGKTEQARADLARLAIIRKQREEAAAKRDEEKKAKEAIKTAKVGEKLGDASKKSLPNTNDLVEDGKNKFSLLCTRCPSTILSPLSGQYMKEEKDLPRMTQNKNSPEVKVDPISEWFLVDNMFTFDNVGVSYAVGNAKYLTCADCEYGPIGWMDMTTQKSYVALQRVRQNSSAPK